MPFKHRFLLVFGLLVTSSQVAYAQGVGTPIQGRSRWAIDRLSVISGTDIDLSTWPVNRANAFRFAKNCLQDGSYYHDRDVEELEYLLADNNDQYTLDSLPVPREGRRFWRHFYPRGTNLFEVNSADTRIRANAILNVNIGYEANTDRFLFTNQRGAEVRAVLGKKLNFYTQIVETQTRYPSYVEQWVLANSAIPGNGLYKSYNSSVSSLDGYDFNNSVAYIAAPITKHVSFEFGHNRHFIGHGHRSLFLSDFSNNYLNLHLHSKFWRFTYDNYFANLSESIATQGATPSNSRRFAAFHHLNFKASSKWNIGLFEAVAYRRSTGIELQYLNPVILYRSVEHNFKSSDNVLLGLDSDLRIGRSVRLYGQLIIDEFLFSSIVNAEQKGWWGNKAGFQLGAKYFNALNINGLDLQVEWNAVRPYTYSHFDSLSNWTHFGQPLAHPLGANFRELMVLARFPLGKRITMQAKYIHFLQGEDESGNNWGSNPNLTYNTRPREYGNYLGQGIAGKVDLAMLDLNWRLAHNFYWDINLSFRRKASESEVLSSERVWFGTGFRMNIWPVANDF